MLDEERLRYTGSIVLGLNDALVELTGALAVHQQARQPALRRKASTLQPPPMPATTAVKEARNQWMRNGYRNERVRQAM